MVVILNGQNGVRAPGLAKAAEEVSIPNFSISACTCLHAASTEYSIYSHLGWAGPRIVETGGQQQRWIGMVWPHPFYHYITADIMPREDHIYF